MMSPHLFLPDGTNATNPGVEVHWQGDWAKGFPVIDDDPTGYDDLIRIAAHTTRPPEAETCSFGEHAAAASPSPLGRERGR